MGNIRTLLRKEGGEAAISDLASVIAAIGGGAITKLFEGDTELFTAYSIGLALGFISFLVASWIFDKDPDLVMTGKKVNS